MIDTLQLALLCCGWAVWCLVHSLLVSRGAANSLKARLGPYRYHYRLLYNCFAAATLLPLVAVTHLVQSELLFSWQGMYQVPRMIALLLSFWLFWDGSRHYAFDVFIGLNQIRSRREAVGLAADGVLSQSGSLGVCRHPWYLGSLLCLWTVLPRYHQATVLVATLLSIYLVIGAWLEERRLVAEYGEKYRQYQREVSMLVPVQWMKRWLSARK